jgi:hypothetical protein
VRYFWWEKLPPNVPTNVSQARLITPKRPNALIAKKDMAMAVLNAIP